MALSHQHTIAALQQLRNETLLKREALPTWLTTVRATIYKRNTPLAVRQLISGADQNKQSAVTAVKISRVVELMLEELAADSTMVLGDAIKVAIQKSGYKRPTTKKQLEEWSGPAQWAQSCSSVAVEALKAVEGHGLAATLGSLRSMRALLTPQARLQLAQRMLGGIRTQAAFEEAVRVARHEMLVEMHWRQGNPHLDSEKGVIPSFSPPPPSVPCSCVWCSPHVRVFPCQCSCPP